MPLLTHLVQTFIRVSMDVLNRKFCSISWLWKFESLENQLVWIMIMGVSRSSGPTLTYRVYWLYDRSNAWCKSNVSITKTIIFSPKFTKLMHFIRLTSFTDTLPKVQGSLIAWPIGHSKYNKHTHKHKFIQTRVIKEPMHPFMTGDMTLTRTTCHMPHLWDAYSLTLCTSLYMISYSYSVMHMLAIIITNYS